MDLTDRQQALKAVAWDSEAYSAINNLPSAEKTGKWLWADGVRCSKCNYKLQSTGLPMYCPNCGTRMVNENE